MANSDPGLMDPAEPSRSSFPTNAEDFDADDRISFSKLDNKFILEADDGQEFEFDNALKRWVPAVRPHPPTTTTTMDQGVSSSHCLRTVISNEVPFAACWLYSWTMPCWSSKDRPMSFKA